MPHIFKIPIYLKYFIFNTILIPHSEENLKILFYLNPEFHAFSS